MGPLDERLISGTFRRFHCQIRPGEVPRKTPTDTAPPMRWNRIAQDGTCFGELSLRGRPVAHRQPSFRLHLDRLLHLGIASVD